MSASKPISNSQAALRMLIGAVVVIGLEEFFFGRVHLEWQTPYRLFVIIAGVATVWRIVLYSRLSNGFGQCLVLVALVFLTLPPLSYFGLITYFQTMRNGVTWGFWYFAMGVWLGVLAADICERPAPPAPSTIYGDARDATAKEMHRALRTKVGDNEPEFED